MGTRIVTFLLCAWMAFPIGAQPNKNKGVFVDGVVSVVNQKVITHSELWGQSYIMLLQRGGEDALVRTIDEDYLKAVLQFMTMQKLLADLGRQKYDLIADEGNVEKNYKVLLEYLGGKEKAQKLFQRLHLSPELVRAFIRRDNMASRTLAAMRKDDTPVLGTSAQDQTMSLLDSLLANSDITNQPIKLPPSVAQPKKQPKNEKTKTDAP